MGCEVIRLLRIASARIREASINKQFNPPGKLVYTQLAASRASRSDNFLSHQHPHFYSPHLVLVANGRPFTCRARARHLVILVFFYHTSFTAQFTGMHIPCMFLSVFEPPYPYLGPWISLYRGVCCGKRICTVKHSRHSIRYAVERQWRFSWQHLRSITSTL